MRPKHDAVFLSKLTSKHKRIPANPAEAAKRVQRNLLPAVFPTADGTIAFSLPLIGQEEVVQINVILCRSFRAPNLAQTEIEFVDSFTFMEVSLFGKHGKILCSRDALKRYLIMKNSNGLGVSNVTYNIAGVYEKSWTVDTEENDLSIASKPRLILRPGEELTPDQKLAKSQGAVDRLLKRSGAQYKLNGAPVNHNFSVLAAALEDTTGNAHHALVDRYFRNMYGDGSGMNVAHNALKTAIADAIPDLDPPDPLSKAEQMSYLTTALAGAMGDTITQRNPVHARQALLCLQNMDLTQIILGTAQPPDRPNDLSDPMWSKVQQIAWKTAYALATSKEGFATLQKVANSNDGGIAPEDAGKLKNFLNAAQCKVKELEHKDLLRLVNVDPASLLTHAKKHRSLAGDALQGDHSILGGASWNQLSENHPLLAYASGAVRNGFDDDSPGSDLHDAMQRASKMPDWVKRAVKRYNDPEYDKKIKSANLLLPNKFKSPFSALVNEGGVKSLHKHCIGESKAAEIAWRQLTLAHMDLANEKSLILQQAAAQANNNGGPSTASPLGTVKKILIDSFVKTAILEVSQLYRGLRGRYQGRPLQDWEKDAVLEKLGEYAAESGSTVTTEELVEAFNAYCNDSFVLDSGALEAWANQVFQELYPNMSEQEAADACLEITDNRHTDWPGLQEALARVKGEVNSPKLEKYLEDEQLTEEGLINYMKDINSGSELGSSLTTSAGYTLGLTSQNLLTATLGDLIYAVQQGTVPISIAGQFSATGGKEAFVNLSIPAPAVTLEFGTQRKGTVTAGISAFAGYHTKTPAKIGDYSLGVTGGGSLGVAASYEDIQKQGVAYRKKRSGLAKDTDLKEEFNTVIDAAMRRLTDDDKEKGFTSPLQKVLASSDDVSVTYLRGGDAKEKKIKGAGTASVVGNLSVGKFRFGGSVGLTGVHTYQNESWNVRDEKQGATRLRTETAVQSFVLKAHASANVSAVHPLGNDAFRSIGTGSNQSSISADIYQRSMLVKRNLTFVDGDVSPSSFLSYTHQTADGFAESVLNQIDRWTATEIKNILLQMPEDKRPDPGSDEYAAIEKEAEETIRQFVAQAQVNAKACKSHTEWLQLNADKANEINKHLTNSKLALLANDLDEARKEDEIALRIARDPDSWDPILLFTAKAVNESTTRGIPNFGLISNSTQSLNVNNLETMT